VKLLLVRLRLIGDVVFTTPAIAALRRHFPSAEISYLVEERAAPVVSTNRHLSRVITVPHARGWRRIKDDVALARELRASRFDIAIDFHGGPRSSWLTWASRAPVRVGYDVRGRTWMYTRVVKRARELRARHSVENQWDLLKAIDPALAPPADRERDRVEMPVDQVASAGVRRQLDGIGVPASARLIVMHVGAGNPFRRWPESSFAELAADLAQRGDDRRIVLTSGPADRDAASRVAHAAHARAGQAASRIITLEGQSLAELRALMDESALFIGGDSGPLHVASTSDVPVIALFGSTLSERSMPWRPHRLTAIALDVGTLSCRPCQQRVCVHGDFRCLSGISAARVREAAERLLAHEAAG
jgi:lipopolysaccharide heptosyltransferase II